MLETISLHGKRRLRLTPNRSASWQDTKWLMLIFAVVVFTIAIGWAVVGVWVILPFAGIEVVLLIFIMYQVSRSTYRWETLDIEPHTIHFCTRHRTLSFTRPSAHIIFTESENDWHLPIVTLADGEQRIVLGEFLNLEDRALLKETLDNEGIMVCRNHWWKT
ncbi:DUF2244 domain-containing protein [Alteromonas stellipolaris]|uniref:DUF2244 domain-containing protein n=1 Tax=Alteromonas stellipolaris TaxID=233316 RepID=UPI001D6B3A7D|nr:DUF2244 domain-containing protein [Alteromonas stellipolaris]MBZ2163789.1 DUF2244 domain-containing protein [Alteromonas stellipolaris]